MASFAIDSGTLIIGIAEDKPNRTFTLAPQPLDGLAEKMEQIARYNPEPPLHILTEEIPTDADPSQGYLVVHIPASPVAPHMVDGRYYGRGDKTKYVLPDPEVIRLHERRRSADRDVMTLLQHEIDHDPIPADQRRQAHLFLVAQPLAAPRDMLLDLASGPRWNQNLAAFINQAFTPEVNAALNGAHVEPSLYSAGNGFRRARGAARATPNLGDGRIFNPTAGGEDAVELQVHENGGLRLFFSRFSAMMQDSYGQSQEHVILDAAAVSCTRRFLALVVAAAEKAGYVGNWALAFGATGLTGLRAYRNTEIIGARARYDEDTYAETTSVSWAELNNASGAVTRRLVGPLLRALATEDRYATALDDPTSPSSRSR